jgi:hypothetical protein
LIGCFKNSVNVRGEVVVDSQKYGKYTKTSPSKNRGKKSIYPRKVYVPWIINSQEEGIKILEVLCTVREEGKMGVFTAPWRQK